MYFFTKFTIIPNYYEGFEFIWEIDSTFSDPFPWKFYIEESDNPTSDFYQISPEITNAYRYKEDKRRVLTKDNILNYRIKLITSVSTYYSNVIKPYYELSREDFLLAREMMRQEMLGQRLLSGVPVKVWLRCIFGPKCSCLDPIVGDTVNPNCPLCYGTKRLPGYHGPYETWCAFSALTKQKGLVPESGLGPISDYQTQGKICAVYELHKNDIIIDIRADKRYYVDEITNVCEIRRLPILQTINLRLVPTSDIIYRLK